MDWETCHSSEAPRFVGAAPDQRAGTRNGGCLHQAAKLRDQLIREDRVALALELCERCGCATKASES
eukprot:5617376-Amphidinium_carterae.1